MSEVFVLLKLAWKDIIRRCIDTQGELHQLLINFIIVNGIAQIRQIGIDRDRLQALRKFSNLVGVIVFFDVLPRAGNGHTVQKLKEIKIKHVKQCVCCAPPRIELAPRVKGFLSLLENILQAFCSIEAFVQAF